MASRPGRSQQQPEMLVVARVQVADVDATRTEICDRLQSVSFMSHKDDLFMHGRGYTGPAGSPRVIWKSEKPPRKDHDTPDWLTATEFEDVPEVSEAKVQQLARLILCSRKTVAYTGAGISASVIGQAAASGTNVQGWKKGDRLAAPPTFTHHALGLLGRRNLLHGWVQQNHDGLPQKAGFPQELINEIHGSWFDPSNPVVKYCGNLHDRSFPWMEEDADTADLCLVLGTSLGGLNADQVATKTARRSQGERGRSQPAGLGSVILNLQQTPQDGTATLRLFGKSDDILLRLLQDLGLAQQIQSTPTWPKESHALVPYDADGHRLPADSTRPHMWLDLRARAEVRITPGHNVQGAKQPQYMHIGADDKTPGNGTVLRRCEETCSFLLQIEGVQMRLGVWWLESAARGGVEALPIVNLKPKFAPAK